MVKSPIKALIQIGGLKGKTFINLKLETPAHILYRILDHVRLLGGGTSLGYYDRYKIFV